MELGKFFKIAFILCLGLFLSQSAYSQKEDKDKGKEKEKKKEKKDENPKMPSRYKPGIFWHFTGLHAPKDTFVHKYDRIHASVFYNDYIGDKNGVKSKWYSIGFNIGALWDQPFGKSPVGIAIGLGFTHFQWHHNGVFSFPVDSVSGEEFTELNPYAGGEVRKANKFASNYLEVPFEFRIRTQGKVMFKFYPGFKFGVRLNSFAKWKHDNGDKFKEFNFPDLNRIRYGPTLRIGINWFQLYAGYYFSQTFKHGNSPKLQQFEAGITISIL